MKKVTANRKGIYLITNVINKKQYVGSSLNVYYRMQNHRCRLAKNNHKNPKLQNGYNKYGLSNFAFTILEFVEDKTKLLEREQYYIDTLKPWYNVLPIAGNVLGLKHSPETIEKCIAASKRRKGTHHSGHKGRVFKFNKNTLEVLEVYSSTGHAAEFLKIKGKIETAGNKIGESIKYKRNAYGYKWEFEKNLAQVKVDELLEILKSRTISSQAIDTSIEGSETT